MVKSTVGWRPGDVREWLPEVVPGQQPHQGRDRPRVLEIRPRKSDLHEAAELGGQYEAPSDRKGFQEDRVCTRLRPDLVRGRIRAWKSPRPGTRRPLTGSTSLTRYSATGPRTSSTSAHGLRPLSTDGSFPSTPHFCDGSHRSPG